MLSRESSEDSSEDLPTIDPVDDLEAAASASSEGGLHNAPPQIEPRDNTSKVHAPSTAITAISIPIALATGLAEASGTYLGLKGTNAVLRNGTFVFSLLSETGMTFVFSRENMNKTLRYLKDGVTPSDWPHLPSRAKARFAALITGAVTIYGAFTWGVDAYYFTNAYPDEMHFDRPNWWAAPCATAAALIGTGIIACEGIETLEACREMLSRNPRHYSNTFSRYVSPITAGSLGVFGAFNDCVSGYATALSLFGKRQSNLIGFGIGSLLNFIGCTSFEARNNRDRLDAFFGYIGAHCPSLKETISFTIAAFGAGLIAYAQKGLVEFFVTETFKDLDIDESIISPIATTTGYGAAAHDFVKSTGTLYDVADFAISLIERKLVSLVEYLRRDNEPQPEASATELQTLLVPIDERDDSAEDQEEQYVPHPDRAPNKCGIM